METKKRSNIDGVRVEELHEACTESKRPERGNAETKAPPAKKLESKT